MFSIETFLDHYEKYTHAILFETNHDSSWQKIRDDDDDDATTTTVAIAHSNLNRTHTQDNYILFPTSLCKIASVSFFANVFAVAFVDFINNSRRYLIFDFDERSHGVIRCIVHNGINRIFFANRE